MESFEANTQFVQLLRSLNPSVQSLKKTAHFAIRNWQNEDYLLPTMLAMLQDGQVELNTKSTIFQLIDVLIHESYGVLVAPRSSYSYPYIESLKLQLPTILLQVLPGTNNHNLYNVFTSLKSISRVLKVDSKAYEHKYQSLGPQALDENEKDNVDNDLPYPDVTIDNIDPEIKDPILATWDLLIQKRKQSYYERLRLLKHQPAVETDVAEDELFHIKPKETINPSELSKKQILMRMEDDREAHKRSKENLWVVERLKEGGRVTEEEFYNYYWKKYDVLTGEGEAALLQGLDDFNSAVIGSYKDDQY